VLLLRRYEGLLSIDAPDEDAGPVTMSLRFELNPNDAELRPPAG
jgi:hypothetical protein